MIGVSKNIKYIIVNVWISQLKRVCYVELKHKCINWLFIRHRLKKLVLKGERMESGRMGKDTPNINLKKTLICMFQT